jgi:hypothetical protein
MSRCTLDEGTPRVPDRKQDEVRRVLDAPHPPVPPDLVVRARQRGRALLRRRRLARRAAVLAVFAALAVLVAVAIITWPWSTSLPAQTPPPIRR